MFKCSCSCALAPGKRRSISYKPKKNRRVRIFVIDALVEEQAVISTFEITWLN
jgi:hypothetical protein